MCSCPAHRDLVDCECQCDHTNDRLTQWKARALAAEAELERLHEGEAADPGKPGTWPTPAQWIRRWNDMTPERRLEIAGGAVDGMQIAAVCRYQPGHEGQIAELRAEREALKAAIADVRRLQEMTIATSCRVQAIDQATDTLAVLDRTLAAPTEDYA